MRSWLLSGSACLAILSGSAAFAALPGGSSETAQPYILDAQKQIDAGNLTAAEIQLKNALKNDPNDVGARVLLSTVYLQLHDAAGAEAEIRIARQRGATDEITAPLLGRALLAEGKLNELFQQVQPGNRSSASEAAVRVVLGQGYVMLGQLDKASPLFDQAEKLDPNNLDTKVAKGRVLAATQQLDAASAVVEQVLARDPKQVDALLLKAAIFAARRDFDDALKTFDSVLGIDSRNVLAHVGRAQILITQRKFEDARVDLVAVLNRRDTPAQARYLRALWLADNNRFAEADAGLANMGRSLASIPGGYYLQAAVKLQLKQYAQADDLATKALVRDPQNAGVRRLLARVALAEKDTKRAISTLESITGAGSQDSQALVLMAQAYAASNNLDRAFEYYQRAATLTPNDPDVQTNIALLLVNTGHVEQGISDLDKLAQSKDSAKVAAPVLVLSSLQVGKLDEADKAAQEMVKRDPADPTALNLLGMAKTAEKDYPSAEKIFSDVLKLDGGFSAAQRNLAAVYMITGRFDDAAKVYQKILEAHPTDVQALNGLGDAAAKKQDIGPAVEYLTRAQDASPQDPAPGIALIRLYGVVKDWPKAIAVGKGLTTKFPTSVPVLQALAQAQGAAGDAAGVMATDRHITELNPGSAGAWQEYAGAQLRANDPAGARASLTKALSLAPSDTRTKQAIVELDYRTTGADGALKTAQDLAKDDPVVRDLLSANVLQQAGRTAEAIATLQKSQESHPDVRTLLLLATAERQQNHNDEAENLLKDWIDHHASDLAAHELLGETYLIEAKYGPAITELELVQHAKPSNVVALNNLSIAYQHTNDPRAREVAEEAYRVAPELPAVADTLGWVLLTSGDDAKALPYLQRAAAALSGNMDVQYHLAVALQRAGQKQEARQLLEHITASNQPFENRKEAEKLLDELQHS